MAAACSQYQFFMVREQLPFAPAQIVRHVSLLVRHGARRRKYMAGESKR